MKVLFDSCIWIEDLRRGILRSVLPLVRRSCFLWIDSVAVAEVLSGFVDRRGRRAFRDFLDPFERAGRIVTPGHRDHLRAAEALSALRSEGVTIRNTGAALLDALQAADAARPGALLVTHKVADFSRLAPRLSCKVEAFDTFRERLWSGR